jgi:2-keto-4-pentenoate hydratase/2-oxohepta-3-ene-1,7-dioic acid hydratase in catechol pathway
MIFVRFAEAGAVRIGSIETGGMIRVLDGDDFASARSTPDMVPLAKVRLLSPIARPRIFGIGSNYHHVLREMNAPVPQRPLVFTKPWTAVVGPGDDIVYPKGSSEVFFEGELSVVIGKAGRRIAKADALSHVLGYTCGNDLTERTLQLAELKVGSMVLSKSFDTFAPLGPRLVTDIDPSNLTVVSRVNGQIRQSGHTSDLVFDVPTLIAHISDAITLQPGDVIMTGTPAGYGPIRPGDDIEIEISGIGTLRNHVIVE